MSISSGPYKSNNISGASVEDFLLTQIAPFSKRCRADITSGPRQITALESSMSSPIDRHLTPKFTGGIIMLCSSVSGVSLRFIISGTVGPNMSASSIPTDLPSSDNEMARLTAVVVLPTPPLPDATTIMLPTSLSCFRCGNERAISSI